MSGTGIKRTVPGGVCPRLTSRTGRRQSGGFTLVELVVVLAIAALAMAVIPTAMGRAIESFRYQGLIREVLGELRAARNQAVISGDSVSFAIDLDEQQLGRPGHLRGVPSGVSLDAIVASRESTEARKGAIRFFPDGSSTGGSVMIIRDGSGDGVRLRVDWMLGRITQERFQRGG